jgi:hypothetical protein
MPLYAICTRLYLAVPATSFKQCYGTGTCYSVQKGIIKVRTPLEWLWQGGFPVAFSHFTVQTSLNSVQPRTDADRHWQTQFWRNPQSCISVLAMKTCWDNRLKLVCTFHIHVHTMFICGSPLFTLVCTWYMSVHGSSLFVLFNVCSWFISVHPGTPISFPGGMLLVPLLYSAIPALDNAMVQELAVWYTHCS